MTDNQPSGKRVTIQARTCIKGEAFFESLMADYALPHHVVGPKDVGVDYFCEWLYGDEPTGAFFAAQIKTFTISNRTTPKHEGTEKGLNGLEKFTISNPNLTIDVNTLEYWKGLGMPVYLFAIVWKPETESTESSLDCYYKRFSPVLTTGSAQEDEYWYKCNRGPRFIAFLDEDNHKQGFARDLFIDLMRWSYFKGNISWLNPRSLGLNQFPEQDSFFNEFLEKYREQICATYSKTKDKLEQLCCS